MPTLISREEALARIIAEGSRPECLMCAVLDRRVGELYTVHEDDDLVLILPRYVRCWGHVAVVPRAHVTAFGAVDERLWTAIYRVAHKAARMVEQRRAPKRVYVTSTGSSTKELVQTSRHIHVHIIPIYFEEDRPSDIFSWSAGVYVGEPDEWNALQRDYRTWWAEND
jgi:diadenosine tetraphosphate (Ap4A) HIT family hydrolase